MPPTLSTRFWIAQQINYNVRMLFIIFPIPIHSFFRRCNNRNGLCEQRTMNHAIATHHIATICWCELGPHMQSFSSIEIAGIVCRRRARYVIVVCVSMGQTYEADNSGTLIGLSPEYAGSKRRKNVISWIHKEMSAAAVDRTPEKSVFIVGAAINVHVVASLFVLVSSTHTHGDDNDNNNKTQNYVRRTAAWIGEKITQLQLNNTYFDMWLRRSVHVCAPFSRASHSLWEQITAEC